MSERCFLRFGVFFFSLSHYLLSRRVLQGKGLRVSEKTLAALELWERKESENRSADMIEGTRTEREREREREKRVSAGTAAEGAGKSRVHTAGV